MLPYSYQATIIAGQGLGQRLGYPTINLKITQPLDIASGVYLVKTNKCKKNIFGLAVYGLITFKKKVGLEIYFFYQLKVSLGQKLGIIFLKRLRSMKKFSTPEQLKQQIKSDITQAEKILAKNYV